MSESVSLWDKPPWATPTSVDVYDSRTIPPPEGCCFQDGTFMNDAPTRCFVTGGAGVEGDGDARGAAAVAEVAAPRVSSAGRESILREAVLTLGSWGKCWDLLLFCLCV